MVGGFYEFVGQTLFEELKQEFIIFDHEFFPTPWSSQDWEELYTNRAKTKGVDVILCAFVSEERDLKAFALFNLNTISKEAHLLKIVVSPMLRSLGIAQELMHRSVHLMRGQIESIFLEVSVKNERAVKFYEKYGLVHLCVKKRFYKNGDDAYAMQLRI